MSTSSGIKLIDFAIITIFAREVLEGAIIIGQYCTIILRGDSLKTGITKQQALREVTLSSLFATAFALLVIAAVAIPLALLSRSFDPSTSKIIEGVSKIVAAISLLQLSLKLPKWLGIYGSAKKKKKKNNKKRNQWCCRNKNMKKIKKKEEEGVDSQEIADTGASSLSDLEFDEEAPAPPSPHGSQALGEVVHQLVVDNKTRRISASAAAAAAAAHANVSDGEEEEETDNDNDNNSDTNDNDDGMTLHSIRFNVAWNIWREVAECGVFLIPFFLSGENLTAIPLSAVVGAVVGLLCGIGIYIANKRFKKRLALAVFASLLLVMLSAGLFTGGCHNLENVIGSTPQVWVLKGDFWSVDRLPMTIFKPFGYNDSRTVLEIVCFWSWLLLAALLHLRKYMISPKINQEDNNNTSAVNNDNNGASGEGGRDVFLERANGDEHHHHHHHHRYAVDIEVPLSSSSPSPTTTSIAKAGDGGSIYDYSIDYDTVEMGDSSLEGEVRSKTDSQYGRNAAPRSSSQVSSDESSVEVVASVRAADDNEGKDYVFVSDDGRPPSPPQLNNGIIDC